MPPSQAQSLLPPSRRTVPWGLLFCGYCAVVLVAQLIHQSAIKPLWRDELFSLYEVQGKTFGEILQSLKGGINLLPPTYFLLLSALLHFADFTPLLGRALSCSLIVVTVPLLWIALRRTTGVIITAVAVSGVMFCSPLIYYHNSEVRPYGLLLFASGLVAWVFVRSVQEERTRPSTLVLLVAANAFLPSVNYIGGLYGAAALAVTLVLDLIAGRMRWRVYGAYLGGWALFAVFVLPLCWVQYQTRGLVGTRWLPDFHESAFLLVKQWTKILIPFAAATLPFAVWLLLGRRNSGVSSRSSGDRTPSGNWPIAALGLAWVLIPVIVIAQSLVTHRNIYMDRYFIASDLGLLLLFAALASLACARWRGHPAIENALPLPLYRAVAATLALSFVLVVSIRFYRNGRNELWGTGGAIYACKAWPGPKATFSLSYYIEGYVRTGPGMKFILLSRGSSDRRTIRAYCPDFDLKDFDDLAGFPEFVYVDSSEAPAGFNVEAWARSHHYEIDRVAVYDEAHDVKKGIFRVKRTTEDGTGR